MTYKLLNGLVVSTSNLPSASTSATGIVQLAGDIAGTSTSVTVTGLQTVPISNTAPSDGYVLTYSSADGKWEPKTNNAATFTAGGDLTGTTSSQQVVSLTGSGGTLAIATTGALVQWATATSSPQITQASTSTSSATGQTLTIRSQNATGTTSTGGNLNLSSGSGTSTNGSINFQIAGTTAVTISSALGTGVVHSNSSGLLSSSLIVNADVSSSAAIAGTKISPSFGAQTVSTTSGITSPNIDTASAGTFSIGTINATAVTIGSSGITTTVAGNLIVNGTTTTIQSTVVDIADRVINLNYTTGTIGVPTQITGIDIGRGNTGTTERDHVGLFWDETNQTWKAAYNTAGDGYTLGNYLSFYASTLGVGSGTGNIPTITSGASSPSGSAQNGSLYLKADGSLWTYNSGWSTVSSSAFSAGGDLTGSSSSQQVVSLTGSAGTISIATTGANIQWVSGTSSPTISQANNSTNSITAQNLTIQAQNATGTTSIGGNLILTSGSGTSTNGSINLQVAGTTTASIVPNKFVFNQGCRRHVTTITNTYTILTTDNIIAVGTLSSGITISMPSSPSTGDFYDVKDVAGTASTKNVTISGNGNTIDGASTYVINQNYASITLVYNGTEWSVL